MAGRNRRVVKYRKRRNINIGFIVFAALFLYITIYMIVYLTRDKVTIYEVVVGKNASITNQSYTALALRDEYVVNAETSGYLNYFVKECSRVSVLSTVYAIDESGTINSILSNTSNEGSIMYSAENELDFKNIISEYIVKQSDLNFYDTYDFKQELNAKILESINLNNIMDLMESTESTGMQFKVNTAVKTGIVAFYADGYENITEETLTADDFSTENYSKISHVSGDLIEQDSPVYKVCNSEYWNLYFKISDKDLEKYRDETTATIKILNDDREVSGSFEIIYINGIAYGKLTLNKYMSIYVKERFLEIRLVDDVIEGLKIPKSSVVNKDFYIIPIDYAALGGDSTDIGFYKKVYDDNQNESIEFVTPTIYYSNDSYYYVDMKEFVEGDNVVKPNSTDTYRIGGKASLDGVYNVNNGYCLFRNIEILTETGDYYLVDKSTSYGLKVYDHIVIDGSMVEENQVVFSVN